MKVFLTAWAHRVLGCRGNPVAMTTVAVVTSCFIIIADNVTTAFLSSCFQSHLVGLGEREGKISELVYGRTPVLSTCMSRGVGRSSTKRCLEEAGVSLSGVTVLRGTEKFTSNLPSSVRESRVNSEGDFWCKMTPTELQTKLR